MTEATLRARIVFGTEQDIPAILRLIKGLADYEALSAEVEITEDDLQRTLFGDARAAEVLLTFVGAEAVGFAVFFTTYSTFLGRPGIYVEDLFIEPAWRKRGLGKRLLARVASLSVERGCGRMEWSVLDWNEPAIRFYDALGAKALDQWTMYRLRGDALRALASCDEGAADVRDETRA